MKQLTLDSLITAGRGKINMEGRKIKMENRNMEKLKKLRELALRGVDGEKEQAIAMLEKLTKKYGILTEELDEEIIKDFRFTFHGDKERRLLLQITYKITNETNRFHTLFFTNTGRKCKTECEISCTEAQKIEIEFLFDFYKKLWEKELEALFSAYIQKHQLFGKLKNGEEGKDITLEERIKMEKMMYGLSNENPILQIEKQKENKK